MRLAGVMLVLLVVVAACTRSESVPTQADTSAKTLLQESFQELDEPPYATIDYTHPEGQWQVSYPMVGWYRARESLTPRLHSPREVFSIGTIPLNGGGLCNHMPEQALRDLGPSDALVSIYFGGVGDTPWPRVVDPGVLPAARIEAHDCAERDDFTTHWGQLTQNGRGIWVLVAFGEDVTNETARQAWAVVNSFKVTPGVPEGAWLLRELAPRVDPSPLEESEYLPLTPVPAGSGITAAFERQQVGYDLVGRDCFNYRYPVTLEGNWLRIHLSVIVGYGCGTPDGETVPAEDYLWVLLDVARFEVAGDVMKFYAGDDTLVMVFDRTDDLGLVEETTDTTG